MTTYLINVSKDDLIKLSKSKSVLLRQYILDLFNEKTIYDPLIHGYITSGNCALNNYNQIFNDICIELKARLKRIKQKEELIKC